MDMADGDGARAEPSHGYLGEMRDVDGSALVKGLQGGVQMDVGDKEGARW